MDRTSTLIEGIFPFNPLWLAGLGGEEKIIYSFLVLGVSFLVLGVGFSVLGVSFSVLGVSFSGRGTTTKTITCVSRRGPRKWKSSNDDHLLAPEVKETHNNMLWEK